MPGELHPRVHVPPPGATVELSDMADEEGIALALALCPEGQSVYVHEADCKVTAENPDACTCDVVVIPRSVVPSA